MRPKILDIVDSLGFDTFENGDWDLNIIGIRNKTGDAMPNKFDDQLAVVYKSDGNWVQERFRCTTDPGFYHLQHPGRVAGTAIMVAPQQARSKYIIRKHAGKYPALCLDRAHTVRVWRDGNRDQVLDYGGPEFAGYGINIHRATTRRGGSVNVDKWSAGCTVISDPDDFDRFMWLCRQQKEIRGWSRFTYTLIDDKTGDV